MRSDYPINRVKKIGGENIVLPQQGVRGAMEQPSHLSLFPLFFNRPIRYLICTKLPPIVRADEFEPK